MAAELIIRYAEDGDAQSLLDIYNHYVLHTSFTFDIGSRTLESRQTWLQGFARSGRHQCFVAAKGGQVVGWASSGRFNDRAAYDTSVLTSVYLAPGEVRKGYGRLLYQTLFAALVEADVHRAYAWITLPNEPSEALHRAFGFYRFGVAREVGRKFGRYWDVAYYEKALP